ncbi:glycosyltransferase 87 family protein [Yinghuangia soli]|uniref:glycosyltransferase 87 family protein n=1 Tax=Yinghuangia soli TaxID=2908204 RepID=UPI003557A089
MISDVMVARTTAEGRQVRPGSDEESMSRESRWSIAAAWAVSRAWLFLVTLGVLYNPYPIVTDDVRYTYFGWYEILRAGSFPIGDVTWQYPPGAAGALLLPGLLPLSYPTAFFTLMLAADLAALVFLLRGPSRLGAMLWVAAVPVLGPMILSRYDLLVTALAVAALSCAARPRVSGVLTGVAAAIKVWPVLLLIGAPRGRRLYEAALWTLVGAGAVVLGFAAALPGAFDFVTAQRDRGIEIEAVAATPFHIARAYGWSGEARFTYGSMEFLGPHIAAAGRICLAASALDLVWLLLWRRQAQRWTHATMPDAALTAVLLFVVTSRVLSPQYMVWLIGLAAVCLTRRETTQRPAAVLILLAVPLTTWEFPVWFGWLAASEPQAVAVLAARNVLLVAAAVWSARRLWNGSREPEFTAADWPAPVPRAAAPSPAPARSGPPSPDATRTGRAAPGSV